MLTFAETRTHLQNCVLILLKRWTRRVKELQPDENALHDSMPPYLRKVLSGKRLLLLGEMMEEAKCPDHDLVKDIRQSFRISGWVPLSGNSQPRVKRPAMTMDTLLILFSGLLERLRTRQDHDLELAAWEETRKELDAGWSWLSDDKSNKGLLIALRFALRQGPTKIRLIDDCTINGLNGTIGLRERFELHTIHKMAAMALRALGRITPPSKRRRRTTFEPFGRFRRKTSEATCLLASVTYAT